MGRRSLLGNTLSLVGLALAIISFVLMVLFLGLAAVGEDSTPYLGLLAFLFLPALLLLGLLLALLGAWQESRRRGRVAERVGVAGGETAPSGYWPRRSVMTVSSLVVVVVAVVGFLSLGAYNYMDSVGFCGSLCHTVMEPEYTAYQDSPHANVSCVECHIGPGADWYVKGKLSGVGQVFAALFNTFPRPLPTPLENLRPAMETCEECHWPGKFYVDRVEHRTTYASDETNTPREITVTMHIGGSLLNGVPTGVHWHVNPANQVEYAADDSRQKISWVRLTKPDGSVVEYTLKDQTVTQDEIDSRRTMDCLDCHNRPTHTFLTLDRALDNAMEAGLIDKTLPFAKKTAATLLGVQYASVSEAEQAIDVGWQAFYSKTYPDIAAKQASAIAKASEALQAIYVRNNFPDMRVTWGTYPNNLGHHPGPGCFRCHDGQHVDANGNAIRRTCSLCHTAPQSSATPTPSASPQTGPSPSGTPAPAASPAR